MKGKKTLWIVVMAIAVVALASSGWIFNIVSKNSTLLKNNEMVTLQTTFVQQYGSQAIIKQMVSPDRVYAALWELDGVSHISWSIGGLWVTVRDIPQTTPAPTP